MDKVTIERIMNGYTGGADVVERAGAKNCFSKLIDSDRGLARVSEYLMFFFLFLESNTVYSSSKYNHYIDFLFFASLIFLLFTTIRRCYTKQINILGVVFPILVSVPILIVLAFLQEFNYSLKKYFLLVLVVPTISYIISLRGTENLKKTVFPRVVNTFLAIVIPGLVLWCFGIVGIIKPNMTMNVLWASTNGQAWPVTGYFGLLYEMQRTDLVVLGSIMPKFTSIFVEAPVFAAICIIVLTISLFWIRTSLLKIILISACGLLSFSTTAFLIIPFLLIVKFLSSTSFSSSIVFSFLKKMFFPLLLICLAIFLFWIFPQVVDGKLATTSGGIHLNDAIADIKAFADEPLSGQGLSNDANIAIYMEGYKDSTSQTSTLLSLAAQGGVLLLIVYILPLLLLARLGETIISKSIPVITIFLVLFICTLEYAGIVYFLIAVGYSLIRYPLYEACTSTVIFNKVNV